MSRHTRQEVQADIRVGVLGLGRIGQMHANLVNDVVEGARVVSIYDVDSERADSESERLGVAALASASELIASGEIDAVAICTNTDSHVDLITEAGEAGLAIFCEKPVSLSLEQTDLALASVARGGGLFQVGFNRRFDPAHAAVHKAVANGVVGDPHLVKITSRDPSPPPLDYVRTSGGLFLDMTIHDFDMARFIAGSEVTSVYAEGSIRNCPEYEAVDDIDTATVMLRHANDCLTLIDNSRQCSYGYDQRVEVHGSLGMAASENPPAYTAVVQTADGSKAPVLSDFFLDRYRTAYIAQWDSFVASYHGRRPRPLADDARAPLVIALAADRSRKECRPIALGEIDQ